LSAPQADLTPLDILDQKTALQAYVSAPMHDQRDVCVYCSCVLVAGPLATFAHELPLLSDHGCVHTRGRLEREHRTALVALDEIAQQSGQRPVYQKRGNILCRSDAKKVICTLIPELSNTQIGRHARAYVSSCARMHDACTDECVYTRNLHAHAS
jgi:hypothetical protein